MRPKRGIYIHFILPHVDIYEKGKEIQAGESVIKIGKFESDFIRRTGDYFDYWRVKGRDESAWAGARQSTLVLQCDGVPVCEIRNLENYIKEWVPRYFMLSRRMGRSEYYYVDNLQLSEFKSVAVQLLSDLRKKLDFLMSDRPEDYNQPRLLEWVDVVDKTCENFINLETEKS